MIVQQTSSNDLPADFKLSFWSALEYSRSAITPQEFLKSCQNVWWLSDEEGPLLVAGVRAPSLVGTLPELWLLVSDRFETNLRRRLFDCARLMIELGKIYPSFRVLVDLTFFKGRRFAKFLTFKSTGAVEERNGRYYEVFEWHSPQHY